MIDGVTQYIKKNKINPYQHKHDTDDRKHLHCQPSLGWPQPHICTTSLGAVCAPFYECTSHPLFCHRGLGYFLWAVCISFKSISILLENEIGEAV